MVLTDFWNFLISLRATVPGLNLCGRLTPPLTAMGSALPPPVLFLAAFVASCFLGALPPVFFLAVYLVLAIYLIDKSIRRD
jgi:histone H3